MVYIFLAEGFEEIEALCPLDILRRAGADVKTVAIGGGEYVTGSHGICVKADMTETEFSDRAPEMIVLPGGLPGATNLDNSSVVERAIFDSMMCGAYICAICAAPFILGKREILTDREAICYPGFEEALFGAKVSEKRVVRDGNIITAAGMGVALEFGLALVEALCGKEKSEEIRKAVLAD